MTTYFLIPYGRLTRELIGLSVSPRVSFSQVPTRTINNYTFYVIEADESTASDQRFLPFKPYTREELLAETNPDLVMGQLADFVGALSESFSAPGNNVFTYTVSNDRIVANVWFESISRAQDDTLTVQVQIGGNTVLQPVTNWFVQSGLTRIEFPPTPMMAGTVIKLVYNKTSSSFSTAAFTMNLEQFMLPS